MAADNLMSFRIFTILYSAIGNISKINSPDKIRSSKITTPSDGTNCSMLSVNGAYLKCDRATSPLTESLEQAKGMVGEYLPPAGNSVAGFEHSSQASHVQLV